MHYRSALIGMALLGLVPDSAAAAPEFFEDCIAPESTVYLRIESCTFALQVSGLDDKQRVQALLNRAKGYAARSWPDAASADLAEAQRLAPDDRTVSAALADLSHFIGGKQDRAIAGYKQVLHDTGEDVTTLLKLGMSYIMANRFDLAQQAFDRVLAADPDNVEALTFRSTTYAHAKQFDRALADLDRAVALAPGKAQVRQWHGEELLYAGQFERAIEDFDFSIKARPNNPLYRMRGIAKYMTGEYTAAQEDFHRDLSFDPVYAHLATWRFFAAKRAGGDGSAEMMETITMLDGRWPTPLLKFVLGQATSSEVLAAVASTHNPTLRQVRESQARCAIGEWLLLNGEKAAAREHFTVSNDLGIVVAMGEVKERRSVFPPETLIEFAVARARLREPVQ